MNKIKYQIKIKESIYGIFLFLTRRLDGGYCKRSYYLASSFAVFTGRRSYTYSLITYTIWVIGSADIQAQMCGSMTGL